MIREIPTPVCAPARSDIAILQVWYIWNVGASIARPRGMGRRFLIRSQNAALRTALTCAYSVSAAGGQKKVEKLLIWCLTNCQVRGNISKLSARAEQNLKLAKKFEKT